MCGIAGFISDRADRNETIRKMTDSIVHRGPDAEGFWLDDMSGVTMGHRRLSIMDLSPNGSQPMMSEDERYVIAYNGEIYNAAFVKASLEQAGNNINYRGTSDTEILVNSFACLGIDKTLSLIKGMYAIALYDRQDKCLTLIRDRAGEKPLYYGFIKGELVWGSEIQELETYDKTALTINKAAISKYLVHGYIPGSISIYEEINKVKPGSYITFKAPFKEAEETIYWDVKKVAREGEANPFDGTYEEAVDILDELLTESVKGQMISDVPYGAYLSGGIDSATVVSLMTKLSGERKVKTFTIGFDDKKYDESVFARDIAKHLGTEHTELIVTEKELQDVIPMLPNMFGEPFADSSQIPTYLVSKLAKSKVTVSLSGDAGDELFAGYRTYDKVLNVWNKAKVAPGFLRRPVGSLAAYGSNGVHRAGLCLKADNVVAMKDALCHTSKLMDTVAFRGIDVRGDRLLNSELSSMMLDDMMMYHPDDILVKVDRAGMAVSLENRVPFLDKDVMEYVWALPPEYKYDGITLKRILKDVLYRYVPKDMMDRPKKGFSVPLTKWLTTGDTGVWADDLMNDRTMEADGYLDPEAIPKLWKRFKAGKEPSRFVWSVLMLKAWYKSR